MNKELFKLRDLKIDDVKKYIDFLSEIINILFIFKMVHSARLELALPKGQGF